MKKLFSSIFFFAILHSFSFAQTQSRRLEIYSITEYIDGYVIKAIDTSKSDTLSVVSVKEAIKNKRNFEKLIVGKKYSFEFEDVLSQMAAVPTNTFVARIKTTVVWKGGDGMSNRPVYSRNTKGLWIKK